MAKQEESTGLSGKSADESSASHPVDGDLNDMKYYETLVKEELQIKTETDNELIIHNQSKVEEKQVVEGFEERLVKVETVEERASADEVSVESETSPFPCTKKGANKTYECFTSKSVFTSEISDQMRLFSRNGVITDMEKQSDPKEEAGAEKLSYDVEKLPDVEMKLHSEEDLLCELENQPNIKTETEESPLQMESPTLQEGEARLAKNTSKGKNNRKCEVCLQEFTNYEFEYHKTISPCSKNEKKFECAKCELKFSEKFQYVQHILASIECLMPWQCKHCGKTFSKQSQYFAHIAQCKSPTECTPPNFKCETCGQGFRDDSEYEVHISGPQCVVPGGNILLCSHCGDTFPNKPEYDLHVATRACVISAKSPIKVDNSDNREDCGIMIPCQSEDSKVEVQVLEMELKPPNFSCDKCGEIFDKELQYELHVLYFHVPPGLTLQCYHCKRYFATRHLYDLHVSIGSCKLRMKFPIRVEESYNVENNEIRVTCQSEDSNPKVQDSPTECIPLNNSNCKDSGSNIAVQSEDFVGKVQILQTECQPSNLKCGTCGKCFEKVSQYEFHISCTQCAVPEVSILQTECQPVNLKCGTCGQCFEKVSQYEFHISCTQCAVPEGSILTCLYCKQNFRVRPLFDIHVSTRACAISNPKAQKSQTECKPPNFKCERCNLGFDKLSQFDYHISFTQCAVPDGILQCLYCKQNFKEKQRHDLHVSTRACIRSVITPTRVDETNDCKDHKNKSKNTNRKVQKSDYFECENCGESFDKVSQYEFHECTLPLTFNEKASAPVNSDRQICEICKIYFPSRRPKTFKNHLKVHAGVLPFACGHCQEHFDVCFQLERHLINSHPTERNNPKYTCGYCRRSMKFIGRLSQHVRRHIEQLHYCFCCFNGFRNKLTLKRHIIMKHKRKR